MYWPCAKCSTARIPYVCDDNQGKNSTCEKVRQYHKIKEVQLLAEEIVPHLSTGAPLKTIEMFKLIREL